MSTYTPDKWVVIKITTPTGIIEKVLAGWYGGFLQGNSWRLNSGITEVIEEKDLYIFKGSSGSEYRCFKSNYGLSGLTSTVLENIKKQLPIEIEEKYGEI